MNNVNIRKAAIIGCGFVGSASAFALMQSGLFSEMVLIDADRQKAEGEALDISHGLPFAKPRDRSPERQGLILSRKTLQFSERSFLR